MLIQLYSIFTTQVPLLKIHYLISTAQFLVHCFHYSVSTTHFPLISSHYSVPITQFPLLSSRYSVPTTQFPPLSFHYSVPLLSSMTQFQYSVFSYHNLFITVCWSWMSSLYDSNAMRYSYLYSHQKYQWIAK